MLPEVYKLDILNEIKGYQKVVFDRLLPSFVDIEDEAKKIRTAHVNEKSKNFNPEYDDAGIIAEDAYFLEVGHVYEHSILRQEFMNMSVVWLYHTFEKQLKSMFDCKSIDGLKSEHPHLNPHFNIPSNSVINDELRPLCNAIKHGKESNAFKKLKISHPNLFNSNDEIIVKENDLRKYILEMESFWNNAL